MTAPLPPADLDVRQPNFLNLRAGDIVHRFYTAKYEPIFFDRAALGRLNSPNGSYGVLYTAEGPGGAFAETFLRRPGLTLLPADLLAAKAYVRLVLLRPLKLVRFHGPGLARLGATAEVVHGGLPYDVPQTWSQALRNHPSSPDGIAYFARHDDDALCFALFDQTQDAMEELDREEELDEDWFWDVADPYGVGLAPG